MLPSSEKAIMQKVQRKEMCGLLAARHHRGWKGLRHEELEEEGVPASQMGGRDSLRAA